MRQQVRRAPVLPALPRSRRREGASSESYHGRAKRMRAAAPEDGDAAAGRARSIALAVTVLVVIVAASIAVAAYAARATARRPHVGRGNGDRSEWACERETDFYNTMTGVRPCVTLDGSGGSLRLGSDACCAPGRLLHRAPPRLDKPGAPAVRTGWSPSTPWPTSGAGAHVCCCSPLMHSCVYTLQGAS